MKAGQHNLISAGGSLSGDPLLYTCRKLLHFTHRCHKIIRTEFQDTLLKIRGQQLNPSDETRSITT